MLHFILGVAGTGKTTALMRALEQRVLSGKKAILLVPEQLSFESEKALLRTLGPKLSLQVEVLSFTRLCHLIFRTFGGLSNASVSKAAKYLLMAITVEQQRDRLTVYAKSSRNTAFLQTLVDACSEFKTAGVSPERLAEAIGQCDGMLKDKLTDLVGLYTDYQSLMERSYADSDDDLIRACRVLEQSNFFSDYQVFVDGFTTFMAAEFKLLEHILIQSSDVWFAMTCDQLTDQRQGMGVFSPAQAAIRRLMRMARRHEILVAPPEVCTSNARFTDPALAHLAANLMQPAGESYCTESELPIRLHEAADRYAELEYVAASIQHLVREEGLRYRDIVVVARDTDPYLRALELIFPRYGIPYFADMPKSGENHPLISGALLAVEAVYTHYDTQSMLMLAKSPLMGLDAQAVAALENYCYCWDIRGAAWKQDFVANPAGFTGAFSDEDRQALEGFNLLRRQLAEPLLALEQTLSSGNGREFAGGVYAWLTQVGAAEHIQTYAEQLPGEECSAFLGQSAQLWDAVIDILDTFASVLGGSALSRSRLCELFRLAMQSVEVSLPPQTLDQVLVGKADRIRPVDPRAVFVIGAVEGQFPAEVGAVGVFTDAERQKMIELEIEVTAPSLYRTVLEQYFAYYALTLASSRVTVSYPKHDAAAQQPCLPSTIIAQLRKLYPALSWHTPDELYYPLNERAAVHLLAGQIRHPDVLTASLQAFLREKGHSGTLARLDAATKKQAFCLTDASLPPQIFGSSMFFSPSRMDRYFHCAFGYFVHDGLQLRERKRVEFSPLESGNVIHHVLQIVVQRHGGKGLCTLSDDQLHDEVAQIIQVYLEERVEDIDKLPVRFVHLFHRLTDTMVHLLRRLGREFAQSEFQPVAFELDISKDDEVEPLTLQTPEGVRVTVSGKIDRVDMMEKNGEKYIRVVDYKSGTKKFSLAEVMYGINIQMLLYLFTLEQNGKGKFSGCVPAGVLYMPVNDKYVSINRDAADDKVALEKEKLWKMNGLLLEDDAVLRGMEPELAGLFIPAKLGKNGFDSRYSTLASRADMGRLGNKIREIILQMASALSVGDIPARPVLTGDFFACDRCAYHAICGRAEEDPITEIAKIDHAQVLKMLREEDDG